MTRYQGRRFGQRVTLCSQNRFSKCLSLSAPAVFLPARGDPAEAAPPAAHSGPGRECPPPPPTSPPPQPPPGTRDSARAAHAPTVTAEFLIGYAARRHGEGPGGSCSWEPAGQNRPRGATLFGLRCLVCLRGLAQIRGSAEPTRFRSGVTGGTHGRRASREPRGGLCCGSASPAPTSGSARHSPSRLTP